MKPPMQPCGSVLPEPVAEAAKQAESRVQDALDRLLALVPAAEFPDPLVQEQFALHGMMKADEIRNRGK